MLRRAKRVAMVGALVALEMAKNLVAATLHLEVSGMYIDTSEASERSELQW